ncbi:ABC transporter [Flavipsychrobacter stenotrophus]|uniref:ABC transporter n=1 Tax=Flavipsychrobacter stenotrophus TaxID=2077091 RepID=A0A2S7SRJ8_9BACT|nr:ABC transporter ATP-binding protein [Flavipsychrobacter stenotrophus]PQJ09338.1 ABC transporter [Flavipsychrobacter stenotrophus]
MSKLSSVNKYFIKYKWRLFLGLLFTTVSGKFAVMPGNKIGKILDDVKQLVDSGASKEVVMPIVVKTGLVLLGLALLRGFFMFMTRQTLIVMSRHIEYDQKNEIYNQYQRLNTGFYKSNFTGDLMNRISEDVSRVRMYTGPSIMYFTNMLAITTFGVIEMWKVNHILTIYVLTPLPFLALSIYYVNRIIFKKSGKIQAQLSGLTTTAQESFSGIRVIKSFVQEKNMMRFFNENSENYRQSSINLSVTEAVYFPSMNFFIGLSMLSTILIGGYFTINGKITGGDIAKFVFLINLLMFPISSIGMVASMTQRAGASQKRIDEFLDLEPAITSPANAVKQTLKGDVEFSNISFTYPHTGINAIQHLSLKIKPGQKVAIIGKTGSGKSTLAHMMLRMYDTTGGEVLLDGVDIKKFDLHDLRRQIAYTPQEAYLFSDTIYNNIKFGKDDATEAEVKNAARMADLENDIAGMSHGYETVVGERGVMLSGGQKQRMVLARAIIKNSPLLILDECLSAVDTQTEKNILANLKEFLVDKTTLVITHRIFTSWTFDQIIVLDDGNIAEQGNHEELMQLNGRYAQLYIHQTS